MSQEQKNNTGLNILSRGFITLLSGIMIGTYAGGIAVLKGIDNCHFNEVLIFSVSDISIVTAMVSLLVFIAGFSLLFILPGWIWSLHFQKLKSNFPVFLGFSFFVSIIGLIVVTTLYKIAYHQLLERGHFLGLIIFVMVAGLISLWCRKGKDFNREEVSTVKLSLGLRYIYFLVIPIVFIVAFNSLIIDAQPVDYDYSQESVLSIPLGGAAGRS